VILDPEKELRLQQKRKGSDIQIISRQNAYVMTSLLEKTVESGTLAWASGWGSKFTYRDKDGNKYTIPAAGKTGTTQNWADAWTVGFTPYYSTAVWFGFDRPGNSLGVTQTGAIIAGPTWADYMREITGNIRSRTSSARARASSTSRSAPIGAAADAELQRGIDHPHLPGRHAADRLLRPARPQRREAESVPGPHVAGFVGDRQQESLSES
jgi:membrane carboxypeptidase/penicillin-binding protein